MRHTLEALEIHLRNDQSEAWKCTTALMIKSGLHDASVQELQTSTVSKKMFLHASLTEEEEEREEVSEEVRESAERAQRERRERVERAQRERRENAERAQRERRESAEREQRERQGLGHEEIKQGTLFCSTKEP